jgi:hypothetical protein
MHPTIKQKDSLTNTDTGIVRMYGSGYIRVLSTQKSHTDTSPNKKPIPQNKPQKT